MQRLFRQSGYPDLLTLGTILLVLGIWKFVALPQYGEQSPLDPIFRIPTASIALVVGVTEVCFALLSIFVLRPVAAAWGFFAFGTAFLGYHLIRMTLGFSNAPCPCLGDTGNLWPLFQFYRDSTLSALSMFIFFVAGLRLLYLKLYAS